MGTAFKRINERLSKHPELLNRLDRLLDIIENKDGRATLADDAEERVVTEMRELGKEVLEEWAKDESQRREGAILNSGVCVKKKAKKTLLAYHLWNHKFRRAGFLSGWP
jgi:hypothetical protein